MTASRKAIMWMGICDGRAEKNALHRTWAWSLRLHQTYRDTNWALVDQGVVSGVNFLTMVLLARMLGVEQFGKFSIAWLVLLFFKSIQAALVVAPMMSIGPKQRDDEQALYYGAVILQQDRHRAAHLTADHRRNLDRRNAAARLGSERSRARACRGRRDGSIAGFRPALSLHARARLCGLFQRYHLLREPGAAALRHAPICQLEWRRRAVADRSVVAAGGLRRRVPVRARTLRPAGFPPRLRPSLGLFQVDIRVGDTPLDVGSPDRPYVGRHSRRLCRRRDPGHDQHSCAGSGVPLGARQHRAGQGRTLVSRKAVGARCCDISASYQSPDLR